MIPRYLNDILATQHFDLIFYETVERQLYNAATYFRLLNSSVKLIH